MCNSHMTILKNVANETNLSSQIKTNYPNVDKQKTPCFQLTNHNTRDKSKNLNFLNTNLSSRKIIGFRSVLVRQKWKGEKGGA